MSLIITSIDPEEIKKQSEKYRIECAKVYYELRKNFDQTRWKKFNSPEEVLVTIDYILGCILEKMQKDFYNTPIEKRAAGYGETSTAGVYASLHWVRFNQKDRDEYAEKYKGLYLEDYVSLDFTFTICDEYKVREKK